MDLMRLPRVLQPVEPIRWHRALEYEVIMAREYACLKRSPNYPPAKIVRLHLGLGEIVSQNEGPAVDPSRLAPHMFQIHVG